MFLSAPAFNNFLGSAVRQDVIWRRAAGCPCVNPNSGQASANCQFCGGVGWLWDAGKKAHTGLQSMRPATAQAMFGMWDEGDATLTIPSDSALYAAGKHDRLVILDATEPFSQIITPGINERIHGTVVSIDRVFWILNGALVEGPEPKVDERGVLTWPNGSPPDDTSYSVSGRKKVELYLAKDIPNSRNSGVTGLPRKVAARRFDLLGRAVAS